MEEECPLRAVKHNFSTRVEESIWENCFWPLLETEDEILTIETAMFCLKKQPIT